jgi:hypothetical protein
VSYVFLSKKILLFTSIQTTRKINALLIFVFWVMEVGGLTAFSEPNASNDRQVQILFFP